jgi:PAS domain-containing protein
LFTDRLGQRRSVAIVRDIREREQAETVLQTTLQRFYLVLSSMSSAVLLVTADGRVEFANQAFCDRFGLNDTPADLVGISSRDMIEKIKNAYLRPDEAGARIAEIVARGQPVKAEELTMWNGATCLRDFVPLTLRGGSCGRMWLHFDITERKRAKARHGSRPSPTTLRTISSCKTASCAIASSSIHNSASPSKT